MFAHIVTLPAEFTSPLIETSKATLIKAKFKPLVRDWECAAALPFGFDDVDAQELIERPTIIIADGKNIDMGDLLYTLDAYKDKDANCLTYVIGDTQTFVRDASILAKHGVTCLIPYSNPQNTINTIIQTYKNIACIISPGQTPDDEKINWHDIAQYDPKLHKVEGPNGDYTLTPQQRHVFKIIISSPRIYSREDLAFSQASLDDPRMIDNQIKRIRKAFSRIGVNPQCIATIYGAGYRFNADALLQPFNP